MTITFLVFYLLTHSLTHSSSTRLHSTPLLYSSALLVAAARTHALSWCNSDEEECVLACGQALMLVSHGEDAKALLARGGVLPSVGALAARTDIAAPLAWDGRPAPGWPGGADMPLKMATVLANLSYSEQVHT